MKYIHPVSTLAISDDFAAHVARRSVNPGVDYKAPYGSPVWAIASGTVTDADNSNSGSGGRTVHIDHDDGSGSDYLHLSRVTIARGVRVAQGDLLGYSGASGNDLDWYYGPHLHISLRTNHQHGYGGTGNVDFDAIVRTQIAAVTAVPIKKENEKMFELGTDTTDGIYVLGPEGVSAVPNAQVQLPLFQRLVAGERHFTSAEWKAIDETLSRRLFDKAEEEAK